MVINEIESFYSIRIDVPHSEHTLQLKINLSKELLQQGIIGVEADMFSGARGGKAVPLSAIVAAARCEEIKAEKVFVVPGLDMEFTFKIKSTPSDLMNGVFQVECTPRYIGGDGAGLNTFQFRTCSNCERFEDREDDSIPFRAGMCRLETEVSEMKPEGMATICHHDGGVYVGPNFCCKHFLMKRELWDEKK